MKRYRLLRLFVFLVIFLIAGRAEALDVEVDGEVVFRQAELVEGSAYIPLRELLDALGEWDLTWDQASRTTTAEGDLSQIPGSPVTAPTVSPPASTGFSCKILEKGLQ